MMNYWAIMYFHNFFGRGRLNLLDSLVGVSMMK